MQALANFLRQVYAKGFFHLFSSKLGLRVLGFGSQIFVVALLSPVQLGQIRVMQSINQVATVFALFGFVPTVKKFCSEDRGLPEKVMILVRHLKLAGFTTALSVGVVIALSVMGKLSPDGDISAMQVWFVLAVPGFVAFAMLSGYLEAIKQVKKLALSQILSKLFGVVVLVVATYAFGIYGFVLASVLLAYVGLPILLYQAREYLFVGRASELVSRPKPVTLRLTSWGFLAGATNLLLSQADILLLNFMGDDRAALGIYSIALILLIPFRELTDSVRSVSFPYLAEKNQDERVLLKTVAKYQRIMLTQAVLLVSVALVLAMVASAFFVPDDYSEVGTYFSVLMLSYLFHSASALLPTTMVTLGSIRHVFYASAVCLPFTIISYWYLISNFDVLGAALGKLVGSALMMLSLFFFFRRALRQHFRDGRSCERAD